MGPKLNRRKSRNVKAQRIAVASLSFDATRTPLLIGGLSLYDWMIHLVRAIRLVFSFTEVKFGQGCGGRSANAPPATLTP